MSFKLKNTETFLTNYSNKLIRLAKARIDKPFTRTYKSGRTIQSALKSSGQLKDSLQLSTKIVRGGDFFQFNITGKDYGEKIDEGTKAGTSVRVNDIVSWINRKPVTLDSIKNKNRVANLIAQKINREGIKPVPFLTELVNQQVDSIIDVTPNIIDDISKNIDEFMIMLGYGKTGETFKKIEK
tara:strand:+ start:1674 stop:2222 length:549 start_codon:yes stop_codon:yes gene_type:complete